MKLLTTLKIVLKHPIVIVLLLFINKSNGQTDYLNWSNEFPSNSERANNKYIRSKNVKLSYSDGFFIKSSGGSNDINESTLRNNSDLRHYKIYDAGVVMKFTTNGATPECGLGMGFSTYSSYESRVITFRFVVNYDGKFYYNIDSAEYSNYKGKLDQYQSLDVAGELFKDGTEITMTITRQDEAWKIGMNNHEIASIPDHHYYPFTPDDITFLFHGKYTLKLNSLSEDYALSPPARKNPANTTAGDSQQEISMDEAWKNLGKAAEDYSKQKGLSTGNNTGIAPKISVLGMAGFVEKRDLAGLLEFVKKAGVSGFTESNSFGNGWGKSNRATEDSLTRYSTNEKIKISEGLYEDMEIEHFKNGSIEIIYPFHWFDMDAVTKEITNDGYKLEFGNTYLNPESNIRMVLPEKTNYSFPNIVIFKND